MFDVYLCLDTVTKISFFLEYGKKVNNLFEALVVCKSVGPLDRRDYAFLQTQQFRLIEWSSDILERLQRKTKRKFLTFKIILNSKPLAVSLIWNKKHIIFIHKKCLRSEEADLCDHYLNLENDIFWSLYVFDAYSLDFERPPV